MTNAESKIKKWEMIKKGLLSIIPAEYTVDVEGLNDDSKYFHPIIKVENEIIIQGQGDTDNDDIYAWRLQVEQIVGHSIYIVGFDIEGLKQISRILENWNKYKDKIKQYLEVNKIINQNIGMLQEIKTNIQNNLLNDTFTQEERRECLSKLFEVKEWIENERIIEKYSGI